MRNATLLAIVALTIVTATILRTDSVAHAHRTSRGDGYAEALQAKARDRAAALAATQRAAAREREARFVARETARFSRLYGRRVARWYPLVHRYFPGQERDALYVMRGESGGNRKAGATNGYRFNGLWQLSRGHARKFREVTGRPYFWGVFNAEANARMTAYMSRGGRNWSAWAIRP